MLIDLQHFGFKWRQETKLTNAYGETMTICPYGVNPAGIVGAAGKRIEECFRWYSSSQGILTELEINKWIAGGDSACMAVLVAISELLATQPESPGALYSLGSTLWCGEEIAAIILKWLIQDGYLAGARKISN